MEKFISLLEGKKTYLSSALGIVSVIVLIVLGTVPTAEGIPMIMGFLAAMGLRNAI